MSGESDNDSLKDDLLCSFDKSRQFDQTLHSVSLSMEPNINGRKRYLKKLKHQETKNHFLTPTSAKMHKKVGKSKKVKSIAASIEKKKLKNKAKQEQKLRNGRELRNELREMKRESKLERELCKKMRLQNGRKGKQITKRPLRSNSSWKLQRSASAMAKLNEDTAEVKKDRAIKQRLTSLAMKQIDTVQYENSRYRRRKN